MKIVFARRGYSDSGGAERYLRRLVTGLRDKKIETVLLNDGKWPKNKWPGNHIETLSAHSPASFSAAVEKANARYKDSLLFSFDRIPCADVLRAGDGVHSAFLQRQAAEGNALASWFRATRRKHRETRALKKELFTANKDLHVICNSEMVADELKSLCLE